jgi:O-Antigen ligase
LDFAAKRRLLGYWGAVALVVPVLGLAAADGGYFAESWGWATLAYLWLAALALIVRTRVRLGRLDLALLGSLSALAMWTLVSTAWSSSPAQTPLEAQRALIYVAAVAAVLLLAEPRSVRILIGGLAAGITLVCAWGLTEHVFPERPTGADTFGENRLAEPLGYWNAVGLFAAMGSLLALGLATEARTALGRASAAAAPVVLLPTLYYTFGRAAWLALLVGLGGALLLARARRELLATVAVLAPAPVVGVWVSSRMDALAAAAPSGTARAAEQGRVLAAVLVGLALIAAAAGSVLLPRVRQKARSIRLPQVRPALLLAIGGVLVAGAIALADPIRVVERGYESFSGPPSPVRGDLRARVFTLSGGDRADAWRVAWDDFRENPLLGSGAGSFEQYWIKHRPTSTNFRDAHSLYLETLAELGPLGLAFLAGIAAVVVAAAVRVRGDPVAAGAFGAVVSYLVHAGVDWDWEIPAVTIAALACGASLVVLARREQGAGAGWRLRAGGVALTVTLGAAAVVGLVANGALATSISELRSGDLESAEEQARRASRWAPWSAEPWRVLGEARLRQGERVRARAALRTATERDPRNWVLWAELGSASEGLAQRDAFARAFALNPRWWTPSQRRDLGRALRNLD